MLIKNYIDHIKVVVGKLFGKYYPHHEYWIDIRRISITPEFKAHHIRQAKWKRKLKFYYHTGQFQSPILLKMDFALVDGYSTYLIAKRYRLGKVPVQFVPGVTEPPTELENDYV